VEPDTVEKVEIQITDEEKARLARAEGKPGLDEILNLHDFEVRAHSHELILLFKVTLLQSIARQIMPEKAWAYYSSAADDEITLRENHAAYHRCVYPP
jgi:L-lactate dehydrogenase (cytochrome)